MASDGDIESQAQPESPPETETAGEKLAVNAPSTKSAPKNAPAELGAAEPHHAIFQSGGALFSWLLICLTGFIALCFFLTTHHLFNPGFKVGERVERDLVATHATLVVDEEATKAEQRRARKAVVPVFVKNRAADEESVQGLKERLDLVSKMQKAGLTPLPEPQMLSPADRIAAVSLKDADFSSLLQAQSTARPTSTDSAALKDLTARLAKFPEKGSNSPRQAAIETLKRDRDASKKFAPQDSNAPDTRLELLALSLKPADLEAFRATLNAAQSKLCRNMSRLPQDCEKEVQQHAYEYLPDSMPSALRKQAADLMAASAVPNLEIDNDATEAKLESKASSIKPIMKHINVGQLVVPKNSILTQNNVDNLESAGINDDMNSWPLVLSLWLSLAAATALVGLFLYAYEPKHLFASTSVALMFTLSIVVCVLATTIGKTHPEFVPLPAVALLLTIFLGQRVAVAISLPIAIFLAVDRMVDFNHLLALGTAAGAVIGTYSRRRHSLIAAGIVMSIAQGLAYFVACLIGSNGQILHPIDQLLPKFLMEFGGGMTSAILAIGSLPFLENIFGLVTPFRLAEMTDADQPLLRRLEENAPGTYQHSLAVANLAEAGARAIGGDVNLVRAGAFYHDVGKMVRPRYFIENQLGDKNPHDSMSPEDSRERVLAHVTDGLVLAKEYNLPKAVQDFIPMHQGTSLMAYFYHKACVRDGVENVDPQSYRYPGPKPQSKETSIVMLADVSEAVTHSMHDPSQEEVEAAMTKVFQNRWDDGQFNEAGLSYPELEIIKGAFVHVWRTLHHERLKYPSTTTGRMAVPPETVPPSTASTTTSTNTHATAPTPAPTIAQPAASAQSSSDGN
jgi:putative nucleotidyltransferase with HDIG domain